MKFTRVKANTPEEGFTGARPVILARNYWYGRTAICCMRESDGKLFTVYPSGAAAGWLDKLEAEAAEYLEKKGWK